MKRLAIPLLLAAALSAQTVQITIKQGIVTKVWNILLRSKTTLSAFTCETGVVTVGCRSPGL